MAAEKQTSLAFFIKISVNHISHFIKSVTNSLPRLLDRNTVPSGDNWGGFYRNCKLVKIKKPGNRKPTIPTFLL